MNDRVFDADIYSVAGKLALELECLLIDTKDLSVVSKWWDSAHDALEQWRSIKDTASQPDEAPTYIPYTDAELEEAILLLDKAETIDAKCSFIWETIYDHGNGKRLGALSRAQREVAWRYLDELKTPQPVSQEPVAVVEITYGREPECYVTGNVEDLPEGVFKLYTAPQPVNEVELTDKEIAANWAALSEAIRFCPCRHCRA